MEQSNSMGISKIIGISYTPKSRAIFMSFCTLPLGLFNLVFTHRNTVI